MRIAPGQLSNIFTSSDEGREDLKQREKDVGRDWESESDSINEDKITTKVEPERFTVHGITSEGKIMSSKNVQYQTPK